MCLRYFGLRLLVGRRRPRPFAGQLRGRGAGIHGGIDKNASRNDFIAGGSSRSIDSEDLGVRKRWGEKRGKSKRVRPRGGNGNEFKATVFSPAEFQGGTL